MTVPAVLAEALPDDDPVEDTRVLQLEPRPRVVGLARAFVAEHAPELSIQAREVLALLTSELVTNAVIHARTPLEVGVTVSSQYVLVTVHDLDLGRKEQRPYERDGGRGLGLVQALSDASSTVRHSSGGKTAWFRIRRDADDRLGLDDPGPGDPGPGDPGPDRNGPDRDGPDQSVPDEEQGGTP